jgi:iron-sulfur cluster repair protein YtfE (RIC family)
MADRTLAAALEQEHREIDAGIEAFSADPSSAQAPQLLARAFTALRRHIYLEEEYLFPALQADGANGLMAPIFVMLREHAQLWQTLDELDGKLAAGCGTPDLLNLCHQLLVQLQHHNLKEERILYPEADQRLTEELATRFEQFLDHAALPERWVCFKARS